MKQALLVAAAAMLTTTLFVVPVTLAGSCATSARHDEMTLPVDGAPPLAAGQFYLYANATDTANAQLVGIWQDSNRVTGLQVSACKFGSITVYRADTRVAPP